MKSWTPLRIAALVSGLMTMFAVPLFAYRSLAVGFLVYFLGLSATMLLFVLWLRSEFVNGRQPQPECKPEDLI
jgi:hypothetical protein